jgi:hypothetical protein
MYKALLVSYEFGRDGKVIKNYNILIFFWNENSVRIERLMSNKNSSIFIPFTKFPIGIRFTSFFNLQQKSVVPTYSSLIFNKTQQHYIHYTPN